MRLYDQAFQLVASAEIVLEPQAHLARFVFELFPDAEQAREMRGTLTVAGNQPLAAAALRQKEDLSRPFPQSVPTLTAFPIQPGRADQ